MAPRTIPPPKKNRARCAIKYPLQIIKGDLGPDTQFYLDEDPDETLLVVDVELREGQEHHLQRALATKAVIIPTPGEIRVVNNYDQLYPPNKWTDPISFLHTTQTVEEACTNALADHEYTYYMDEIDKLWLDKNNQEARGEGTSAQGAASVPRSTPKEPEMGVPFSITEDEFELMMGLLEKIAGLTDQKVIEGDFSLYQNFFLEPLPPNTFASYTSPSWIPAPPLLVRIARAVFPHWKRRRSLLGHRIRPSLNYDESDSLNESYVCFRRRDNKPVRKTRAGQLMNNADKLVQLDQNLSQALDIANALLKRETIKQTTAVYSQRVWNARKPLADLIRTIPGIFSKADEPLFLVEKLKKSRAHRSSLPKVKLPPANPTTPNQAVRPFARRWMDIQEKIIESMHEDSLNNENQVDAIDDPYQSPPIPRAETLWVDVLPSVAIPPTDEQSVRSSPLAVRLRYGRGGRRFVDRRSGPRPLLSQLRHHRQHLNNDSDEETTQRLEAQWRFDADDCVDAEEQCRELVDEYDSRYLIARMSWAPNKEATLLTDASLVIQGPDGDKQTVLPFKNNADFAADYIYGKTTAAYLADAYKGANLILPRATPAIAALRAISTTPVQQKITQAIPHPRPQTLAAAMRLPAHLGSPPRMQENITPAQPGPIPNIHPASPSLQPHARLPVTRHHTHPPSPNPIAAASPTNADKVTGPPTQIHTPHQNHSHVQTPARPPTTHPLQTNGVRSAVPAYVALGAGTSTSLRLHPRVPRPSPLSAHSVVAAENTNPNAPSRTNES
ncbi:hypothetical protein DFH07DRAFT_787749 [Mycena maculata]|uniref:Enhancer of polycomb-like protein n=1 Tax=Mycena maculata TaxID=230809 RepID=A0AAD7KF80_9AGAR|nr:hypothetical protein DFH07DRAFT_787749 [Mycena maculata]